MLASAPLAIACDIKDFSSAFVGLIYLQLNTCFENLQMHLRIMYNYNRDITG